MVKKWKKGLAGIIRAGLLLGLALLVFACAKKADPFEGIDKAVMQNDFEGAIAQIAKAQEAKKPLYNQLNAISLFLDKGYLEHYAGNYPVSSQDMQEAERLIEEAFTKSVAGEIASFIANDNTKEYAGEDFEDIYLNVFNAFNYLKQGNSEGALVEIRKLTQQSGKLDMLSRKYEASSKSAADWLMEQLSKIGFELPDSLPQGEPVMFNNSALAQFMGGLLYLADGNEDSARICFEAVEKAYTDNTNVYKTPVPKAVAEVQEVPEGKARLNIFAFTGLSPVKEEGLFTQNWAFMRNPELQEPVFKLPVFRDRSSGAGRVHVSVGGEEFELELIEDMGLAVRETFKAKFSSLFFKTYIRVLIKYAAADIAATAAAQSQGGNLARLAAANGAKAALDATEGADIRMGRFLPDKAYVGGIFLDPGSHAVTVRFSSGETEEFNVDVTAGGLNLISAVSLK